MKPLDGKAIVYCDGFFNTPYAKTAHGLVRFTERYEVIGLIDHKYAGQDAGQVLDHKANGIPIYASLGEALVATDPQYFVYGIAPDGGKLSERDHAVVLQAIEAGLAVDAGLHSFLTEDTAISALAEQKGVTLRDVRKPPHRKDLHFFSGKIEKVDSLKIAILGTDSAVGKRTTAWLIVHALREMGVKAEMIGTGQTGWMQGARYSMILDSLVNDFVSGEIEHAVHNAWVDGAEAIVIEGQGSLMNPAYPGGFEILAAGRPNVVILQHAPARLEYDGFPGYPMHPLPIQIQAIELLSGKPVVAITLNHEDLDTAGIDAAKQQIQQETGLPVYDVLLDGAQELASLLWNKHLAKH